MLFRNTLLEILTSQRFPSIAALSANEVPRQMAATLALREQFALVLTGVRRCGKSTL
jgi:hypothetical protein